MQGPVHRLFYCYLVVLWKVHHHTQALKQEELLTTDRAADVAGWENTGGKHGKELRSCCYFLHSLSEVEDHGVLNNVKNPLEV